MKKPVLCFFAFAAISLLPALAPASTKVNLKSLADEKPSGAPAVSKHARAACEKMSRAAAATGTKTLVIAFEGLGSHNEPGTRSAYHFRNAIVTGKKSKTPEVATRGYLLKGLILPLLAHENLKFEFLVLSHDAVSDDRESVAALCSEKWKKALDAEGKPYGRKLVLMGHSYGAHSVLQLASALESANVTVDGAFSFDPRRKFAPDAGNFARPKNVAHWENYFQRGFLAGDDQVDQAQVNKEVEGLMHGQVMSSPEAQRAVAEFLKALESR